MPTTPSHAGEATANEPRATAAARWNDALLAAACVALDPVGTGGVVVRAAAGDVRDAWLARWRGFLPPTMPVRSIPIHVDDSRLFGGIDLATSLAAGRLVREAGLLEQVAGGCAILTMAERVERATAGRIAGALAVAPFALIALDEGDDDGDHGRIAASLAERIGLAIDLHDCSSRVVGDPSADAFWQDAVSAARPLVATTSVDDELLVALCEAAAALGIESARPPLFALRVTRAIAALHGRERADVSDAAAAARLVLAPRATRLPAAPSEAPAEPEPPEPSAESGADDRDEDANADAPTTGQPLEDTVQEAAVAAIPAGLLARLAAGARSDRTRAQGSVGGGATIRDRLRGAPAGVRRGRPRAPERLALVETLRAAAPWQRVRSAERKGHAPSQAAARVQVRADDLHTRKFRRRRAATTVFVVDASGSSALHRLAEAKGAVELLLADCYVRRDQVAVIAFRGQAAQVLLAPTRSLVRARRSLAELPGGGGTPLAHALDTARDLVVAQRRRGETVLTVFLSDGRANVARDGSGGRARAEVDAQQAARGFRAIGADALFIDTAPRPHPEAAALADAMGAIYHPLPHATARDLSKIVQNVSGDGAR